MWRTYGRKDTVCMSTQNWTMNYQHLWKRSLKLREYFSKQPSKTSGKNTRPRVWSVQSRWSAKAVHVRPTLFTSCREFRQFNSPQGLIFFFPVQLYAYDIHIYLQASNGFPLFKPFRLYTTNSIIHLCKYRLICCLQVSFPRCVEMFEMLQESVLILGWGINTVYIYKYDIDKGKSRCYTLAVMIASPPFDGAIDWIKPSWFASDL